MCETSWCYFMDAQSRFKALPPLTATMSYVFRRKEGGETYRKE